MTVPWTIPGSHDYHPTTTEEFIKYVMPAFFHKVPQSRTCLRSCGLRRWGSCSRVPRYFIRYNSIWLEKTRASEPAKKITRIREAVKEFRSSTHMPFAMRMPSGIAHVTTGFGPAAAHAKSQWRLLWGCMGWGWWCWGVTAWRTGTWNTRKLVKFVASVVSGQECPPVRYNTARLFATEAIQSCHSNFCWI